MTRYTMSHKIALGIVKSLFKNLEHEYKQIIDTLQT